MRKVIGVALLMVTANGAGAQRRGAFVAIPPNAGRPVMPAVGGTPGAALWNPGSPGAPPCCAGSTPNRGWHGHDRGFDRSPQIVAVPVPVFVGSESSPEALPPDDSLLSQPLEMHPQPATPALPAVSAEKGCNNLQANTEPPRAAPPELPYALIAMKDAWVYVAIAYWVDGRTIHYVTPRGDHNQVSLDLVDREMSARLNQGSKLDLILPR